MYSKVTQRVRGGGKVVILLGGNVKSTTATVENNIEAPQKLSANLPHYGESRTVFTRARKVEERSMEISLVHDVTSRPDGSSTF